MASVGQAATSRARTLQLGIACCAVLVLRYRVPQQLQQSMVHKYVLHLQTTCGRRR